MATKFLPKIVPEIGLEILAFNFSFFLGGGGYFDFNFGAKFSDFVLVDHVFFIQLCLGFVMVHSIILQKHTFRVGD